MNTNVCIITIDGRENDIFNFNKLNKILDYCNSDIKFKHSVHLTNSINSNYSKLNFKNTDIHCVKIPQLSYFGYNKFCIEYLYHYIKDINCDHFLIIQDDGFIINPHLWDDKFLEYDYIGAPWINNENEPPFGWIQTYGLKASVGNGGFSLRSKNFLEKCSKIVYNSTANEDVFLCAVMHDYMVNLGIKFPNIELAAKFSLETKTKEFNSLSSCFGFHGKHNLTEVNELLKNKGIFDDMSVD